MVGRPPGSTRVVTQLAGLWKAIVTRRRRSVTRWPSTVTRSRAGSTRRFGWRATRPPTAPPSENDAALNAVVDTQLDRAVEVLRGVLLFNQRAAVR